MCIPSRPDDTMKVALIGIASPPIMGGLEVHIHQLAKHLGERGHDVIQYGVRRYKDHVLPAESMEGPVRTRRIGGTITLGRYEFYEPAFLRMATRLRSDERPDVIHAHCVYPSALAAYVSRQWSGIPYVVTSHGDEIMEFGRSAIYGAAKKWMIRRFFGSASHSIAVSEELRQLAIGLGSPEERTERLSNVIDVAKFSSLVDPSAARRELGLPPDARIILSLRRLSLKNGVHYLIRAFAPIARTHPDAYLVLCGDGEMRGELVALVDRLGIGGRVRFLGSVPNNEVQKVIAASDMAVFPSLAEATSIACLEVMATGVAVVVSDVGGLPEIVTHGQTGLIVRFGLPGSTFRDPGLPDAVVDDLRTSIERLLDDRILRARIAHQARSDVLSRYSWSAYAEKVEGIYTHAILESKGL